MKRTLLLICFISVIISSKAAMKIEVDNLYYTVNDNENSVTVVSPEGSKKYSGYIVIPKTIEYNGNTLNVTKIGENAFYNCADLTNIEIPNSVTAIGMYAFSDCTNLTSIKIPNSVTSIDGRTFQGCSTLTNIDVDNNNPNYASHEGILYTKNIRKLVFCP